MPLTIDCAGPYIRRSLPSNPRSNRQPMSDSNPFFEHPGARHGSRPALCRDKARTFRCGLRAGICGTRCRDRRDCRLRGGTRLCQHHRGAGTKRPGAGAGGKRVPSSGRRPHQRRVTRNRARNCAEDRRPLEQDPPERGSCSGRIDALAKRSDSLGLDAEQSRVLERYDIAFRRHAGAALDDEHQEAARRDSRAAGGVGRGV